MFHGQDQMKSMKMMEMQQEILASGSEDDFQMLTREKAIDAFKVKLRIQFGQMDIMIKTQMMAQQVQSEEAQMKCMAIMMVEQQKASDELFMETGVEDD